MLAALLACNGHDGAGESQPVADPVKGEAVIAARHIAAGELPPGLRFKGKLHEALQWRDKAGDNILITSIVAPYESGDRSFDGESSFSAELHAFHFVRSDSTYKLLWKISDAVKDCPFDLTSSFIKEGIMVTDLDNNGIAETTILYRQACRSDVSPAYMKLVMHQDTVKYALRGSMWIAADVDTAGQMPITENDVNLEKLAGYKGNDEDYLKAYGRYETEKDFQQAPASFLAFARRQWLRFVKESFD